MNPSCYESAIFRMFHRLGLMDLINESIPCNTDVDIGTLVTGMICDTLSGRRPLYKVEEFIAEQDTELLFGTAINSHSFNGDALGHALDRIHQKGTLKLFTEVSLKSANIFNLDTSHCSFDTTSVNVWGNFADSSPNQKAPQVTHGYSKDKRPDLNKRPTKRPTSYLMMSYLSATLILKRGNQRLLPRNGLRAQGLSYLKALGFDETIYTTPPPPSKTHRRP